MSLKELYKAMFSTSKPSREEFFSNSPSTSTSAFEAEAKEGFDNHPEAKAALNRMDKKFAANSSLPLVFFTGAVLLIGGIGMWYLNQDSNETITASNPPIEENAKNTPTIEKTDLVLPDKFDSLFESPAKNVEKVASLIEEQQSIKESKRDDGDSTAIFKIDDLPMLPPIKPELTEIKKQLTVKRRGKEISYHDFLLLDYKGVRHNSQMEIDRLTLSGTAASKETVASGDFQNEAWKKELVSYDAYIEKTAYFLKMGSFKNALSRFDIILQHYPDDINALFYSGFALYNLGQFEKAKSYFILGLQNPYTNFDEECAWYYALCLEANGELEKATKLMKSIANSTSYYRQQAQEKLTQKK